MKSISTSFVMNKSSLSEHITNRMVFLFSHMNKELSILFGSVPLRNGIKCQCLYYEQTKISRNVKPKHSWFQEFVFTISCDSDNCRFGIDVNENLWYTLGPPPPMISCSRYDLGVYYHLANCTQTFLKAKKTICAIKLLNRNDKKKPQPSLTCTAQNASRPHRK